MSVQNAEITQGLHELLKKTGKDFLSLSGIKAKMAAGLKKKLGIRSSHSASSIKQLLEPHLGGELEMLKGSRTTYLAIKREPVEWILNCLPPHACKGPGALGKLLPIFSKAKLVSLLNDLLKEGRVVASLNEKYEVRLSLPEAGAASRPKTGEFPVSSGQSKPPVVESQDKGNRREAFHTAFKDLDQGRIFVRICDLRHHLGWKREEFDSLLRQLRDEEIIQLHSGDVTTMTPQEVEDGFVDENGFRMGTVTWHGRD
ncbi:MAG: hypothetical protein K6E38_00150 [Fretibacterium sp.]|nr:hypothetical protein [Fretibacterium sp.]